MNRKFEIGDAVRYGFYHTAGFRAGYGIIEDIFDTTIWVRIVLPEDVKWIKAGEAYTFFACELTLAQDYMDRHET